MPALQCFRRTAGQIAPGSRKRASLRFNSFGKKLKMPAWSPAVANEFIRLAAADRRSFNHLQLQKLVYIAHGVCLAESGWPLTGDRPEVGRTAPIYQRLCRALGCWARNSVTEQIGPDAVANRYELEADFNDAELKLIARVYAEFGSLPVCTLATLTQGRDAPLHAVFADGAGRSREISHRAVEEHFLRLLRDYTQVPAEGAT